MSSELSLTHVMCNSVGESLKFTQRGRSNSQYRDEILHHFETRGNYCLLVFTGESNQKPGFLGWCRISPMHSIARLLVLGGPLSF